MKVLALLGSPRKGGNTDILLRHVVNGISDAGGDVETVDLCENPVQPVGDCEKCREEGQCTIDSDDNYNWIIEKFINAECVLIATPLYWYSVSAQVKAFMDRWSCSMEIMPDFRNRIRGKKVGIIAAHGEDDPTVTKHLFAQLQQTFQFLGLDFIGRVQGKAYEKGSIIANETALEKAYDMGYSIGQRKYFQVENGR